MPTALITGASAGIGAAFARALAQRGYDLVLVARREATLRAAADSLSADHGISVEVLAADVADPTGSSVIEARLARLENPIDLLINNAGLGLRERFGNGDVRDEEHMMRLNVLAVMRLTHAVIDQMRSRGGGQIINVSSVAGFAPTSPGSTYPATKAWVTSFSESLHMSLRPSGISVLALCPGFTHSEFHERAGLPKGKGSWWLDADYVVQVGLRDLARGKAVSIPAFRYKVVVSLLRHLPRRFLYWLLEQAAHRRLKNQDESAI
ncbi:MAG: SDR family oxidoreductase [Corynebacteriales bacterium]|nr:SDR family oxidoreductase [Mycobacteriales bacterium]